jgi:hypothetical protein
MRLPNAGGRHLSYHDLLLTARRGCGNGARAKRDDTLLTNR